MTTKALIVDQLTKTYKNGAHALKGISFNVSDGDFFALLGPNGAGKSTTIGIITSLVTKSSGKVIVYGHDTDEQFGLAKACIGVVPQEFNFNIFERAIDIVLNQAGYYGIPRKKALANAEKYMRQLGLWDKRNNIVRSLSGGYKRRLMIARALVHEPRMLILDEPTAGVDVEVRRTMWTFIKELNQQGVTIILTTHYLEEAESLCRDVAIIDEGQIIESTSMSNILKKLDAERFILYLQKPISQIPEVSGYRFWLQDESTLEVEVPQERGLSALFLALQQLEISIVSMRNKTNRLEELFINLVGDKTK